MKIYIVNKDTLVALELGDLYYITEESEFEDYTSQELLGNLCNQTVEITNRIKKALLDFGVADNEMIFGPKDYIIKSPSSEFFLYCEETLQDNFTVIPIVEQK